MDPQYKDPELTDWDKAVAAELEAIERAEERGDDYAGGVRGKLEVEMLPLLAV